MRKGLNILISAVALIALVVFCFFVQCKLDVFVIVAGFAVVAAGIGVSVMQEKKLRELE